MAIKVEKIEVLGLNVNDVEAASELFSRLFGIEFVTGVVGGNPPPGVDYPRFPQNRDDPDRIVTRVNTQQSRQASLLSIDTDGFFELIQSHRPAEADEVRNIHLKVADIDAAVREVQAEGIGIVANLTVRGLREVVLDANDLHGARICLVQYEGDSLIEAMTSSSRA